MINAKSLAGVYVHTGILNNKKENKGITLIALVITIIVLLILAGISIQAITNTQLFEKSKIAKEEDKKAQIKEYLNLKLVGEQTSSYDKEKTVIIENTRKEVKEEELKKYGKDIEIKNIEKNNEEVYFYVIIDNEAYKVSLKGAEYIGKRNTNNIELAKGDIEFIYNPTDWTNGKVKVEIKANKNIDGYSLEYKTKDNNTWTKYIKELEVDKNQDIYARLSGVLGQTVVATGTIANIDRLKPKEFTPKVTVTTNSITIEATTTDQEKTSDDECSGIAGYRFSKDNGVNWTDWQTSGNYTFNGLTHQTNYQIKIQVKDNAQNIITVDTNGKTETLKYTVVFNGNGATSGNTQSQVFIYGTTENLNQNGFIRNGYVFKGWSTSQTGEKVYSDKENISVTNNMTLYAVWEQIKISLNTQSAEILAGNTYQLTATVNPYEARNTALTWASSDNSTATVNEYGLVTGKSCGITTITVTNGTYTATATIRVNEYLQYYGDLKNSKTGGFSIYRNGTNSTYDEQGTSNGLYATVNVQGYTAAYVSNNKVDLSKVSTLVFGYGMSENYVGLTLYLKTGVTNNKNADDDFIIADGLYKKMTETYKEERGEINVWVGNVSSAYLKVYMWRGYEHHDFSFFNTNYYILAKP